MNINQPTRGKILLHGRGAGSIANSDLEQRAQEIAVINGRSAEAVNESDLAEARAELGGTDLPATTGEDVEGTTGVIRDPSEPPSVTGHQTLNLEGEDEQKAVERLVIEGAQEAQHDQMLAARQKEHRQR